LREGGARKNRSFSGVFLVFDFFGAIRPAAKNNSDTILPKGSRLMTRYSNHRPGVTLTEVLVALFVMAIGMIALLTLFPLGMMQISQAIKDDRTAQAGNNADYLMRMHWRQYVIEPIRNGLPEVSLVDPYHPNHLDLMIGMENPNVVTDNTTPPVPPVLPKMFTAPDNPRNDQLMPPLTNITRPVAPATYSTITTRPEEASRPSYPVFVDPYGDVARQTGALAFSRRWVAGIHSNGMSAQDTLSRIPRRSLNFPNGLPGTNWQYRYATLTDDMEFGQDGASNSDGTSVVRTGRYNWAYVLQRPSQGNRLNMNMTVVVYDRRAYRFAPLDQEIAYGDATPVAFIPGSTSIAINYNPNANPPIPAPALRSGMWIMDGTINNVLGIRNANFYRVTSVTDDPATGTMILDLQTPLKSPPGFVPTPAVPGYNGQLYVLNGVSEVFERRPLTTDDAPVAP
jgi:hypothetical protein